MKTYYDGEEREILGIKLWTHTGKTAYWVVQYQRGESIGQLVVPAKDELDAMLKFPETLARMSKNYEDDNNVS